MPTILITPAAENDLLNLWIYIAGDNLAAAERVYQAAEKTFETLAFMPGIGTKYHSKRSRLRGLRFFPIKQFPNFVVYYREITEGVEIIRLFHAHMEKNSRLEAKH